MTHSTISNDHFDPPTVNFPEPVPGTLTVADGVDPGWLEPSDEGGPEPMLPDWDRPRRADAPPVQTAAAKTYPFEDPAYGCLGLDDKRDLFAGILTHATTFEAAKRDGAFDQLDPVMDVHLIVTWDIAKDMPWPIVPEVLAGMVDARLAKDHSVGPASIHLLRELREHVGSDSVPDQTRSLALLKAFNRQGKDKRVARRGAPARPAGGGPKASQADMAVALAGSMGVELFHDGEGNAYGSFASTLPTGESRRDNKPVKSTAFREWLGHAFWAWHGKTIGRQAITDAIDALAGQAHYEGVQHAVWIRVAQVEGALYLDLANDRGEAVKVTATGWEVVTHPPVKFLRPRSLRPLPVPVRGGSINEFRDLVNLSDDDHWVLALGWLVGALHPRGPYAQLVINGEQGSAKSTLAKMLRRLIDPSELDLRAAPTKPEDMLIAANNGWVIAYDNLSYVRPELADDLCRLSTGAGLSKRQHYTDADEVILKASRPVIVNGIEDGLASRPDQLDRTIQVVLPKIEGTSRRTEADLWAEFDRRHPRILGALLDAVAAALANVGNVALGELPRMADFASWVAAAEPALPWAAGTFLDRYLGSRGSAMHSALEASPLAATVLRWAAERRGSYYKSETKSASEWMTTFEQLLPFDGMRRQKPPGWPQSANTLSGQLMRIAPSLREHDIEVERLKPSKGAGRTIRISVK